MKTNTTSQEECKEPFYLSTMLFYRLFVLRINVGLMLKDRTQWCWWGSKPTALLSPVKLESSALPLSHCAPLFNRLLLIFKIHFFEKFIQECHQRVKQFGSRSGLTFCQAWSGSKLFAKVLSEDNKLLQQMYTYILTNSADSTNKFFLICVIFFIFYSP